MTDYQGNSHKKREAKEVADEKNVEKVVTGVVVVKPPSLGKKIKGIFFGGEFRAAKHYILADVLLPAARNAMVDSVTKGVERVVYGESGGSRRRPPEMRSRVQYGSMYNRPYQSAMLPGQPPRNPVRMNYREANEILIESREEADRVLERLIDIVDKYEVASLGDLNDLLGLPSPAIDNKWGWTYLNNAQVRQVRNGYMLELPPMEEI